MKEIPLLTSEDIEVKVKQIKKTGALLLLYKTARVDAKILDEVFGLSNWSCSYEEIKGNLFCTIAVREDENHDFVFKQDCGIESGQDDGNEKKAEASDAFKRAATRLGIGRELYTSPPIWADVATKESKGGWVLEDPTARYVVTHIEYNKETRVITELEISNAKNGIVVFDWKLSSSGAMGKKMTKTFAPKAAEESVTEDKDEPPFEIDENPSKKAVEPEKVEGGSNHTSEEKMPLSALKAAIGRMVKIMFEREGSKDKYTEIVKSVTNDPSFKCNVATEEQYDKVRGIYDALAGAGYGSDS